MNQIEKKLPTQSISERRNKLKETYTPWKRQTVASHFAAVCQKYHTREYMHIDGRTYTYEAIWQDAVRYAKGLIASGVKRRDHIAVVMDNQPVYPALMIASSMVGAVFIPINSMLAKDELAYIINQSDARFLFLQQEGKAKKHGIALTALMEDASFKEQTNVEQIICLEDTYVANVSNDFSLWGDLLQAADTITDAALEARWDLSQYPDEVMMILYTSGSTGNPKGVMLTEDMLLRSAYSTAYSRAIEDGRVTFAPLPFYHCFAIIESIVAMSFVGGSFIEAMGASPLRSLQLMEKHQANDFLCVPTTLVPVVNHPDVATFDLSHLFAMWCGAAAAPIPVWEKAIQTLGLTEVITGYGQTEVTSSGVTTALDISLNVLTSRVGRPKLGGGAGLAEFGDSVVQYKTVDIDSGETLAPGMVGELAVRGSTVTNGYYNKPEETAATIDKDGWLRTGDVGIVHEDGYLQVIGRSKEMFKVSGELVSPREIENVLYEHPAIYEVQVIGVEDRMTGEIPAAFIELEADVTLKRKEVTDYCANHLARFKVPRHVWFIEKEDWPLTATGKVQKFQLQHMAARKMDK